MGIYSQEILVGFYAHEGYGDDIENFEQIDLLPKNIEITSYTMSNNFASITGATLEIKENYKNTGRTAIIAKAPKIPYSAVTPDSYFNVANIGVYIGLEIPSGLNINDTFVRADGTQLANIVDGNTVIERKIGINTDDKEEFSLSFLKESPTDTRKWSNADSTSALGALKIMMQRKAIRTYDNNAVSPWSENVNTYPGQKFDYKLELINGTDNERLNPHIYDIFPYVGDKALSIEGTSRESQFENRLDLSKQIEILINNKKVDNMKVQYLNNVPSYDINNVDTVLESAQWVDTPSNNTKAIRIVPKDGKVVVPERGKISVIVPMIANKTAQPDGSKIPAKEIAGKSAYNSFYYKDNTQKRLIEGNRVSNTMQTQKVNITFTKVGYNGILGKNKALQGAEFEYRRPTQNGQNDEYAIIAKTTSDKNGMVKFANIIPQVDDYIVETKAPLGYKVNDKELKIDNKWINDTYTNNKKDRDGNVLNNSFGEFKNSLIWAPITPLVGDVQFKKTDIYGNPLANATFTLSRTITYKGVTNTFEYEATSNTNGIVTFKNVEAGSGYTLTETRAPNNLKPNVKVKNISVKAKQTNKIEKFGDTNTVINDKAKVRLYKLGIDENRLVNDDGSQRKLGDFGIIDGTILEGAVFDVKDTNGKIIQSNITTSKDGEVYVDNIKVNTPYTLIEKESPLSYRKINNFETTFMVIEKGKLLDANGKEMKVSNHLYSFRTF